jgi:pimeloyl-ACP methyl ester carboxylesterase
MQIEERATRPRRFARRAVMVAVCALASVAGWGVSAAKTEPAAAPIAQQRPGRIAARLAPRVRASVDVAVASADLRQAMMPTAHEVIASAHEPEGEAHVWPARQASPGGAPMTVFLHGMCSHPEPSCSFWSDTGRESSFLVCPSGNGRCGVRPDWRGTGAVKAGYLDEVLGAVRARYGALVRPVGQDVLVGFSRGAFVARDVIYERPGVFRGLVLIGAHLDPDPARLVGSGIERVVLAAGEYDGARPAMERSAARMRAAGLPARYLSLGRIGHQLPSDLDRVLAPALRWVRGEGDAS